MHPSIEQILVHFTHDHLPAELASVSRPFCVLARSLAGALEGPELTVALRKLLESKDAAVRAAVVGGVHETLRIDGVEIRVPLDEAARVLQDLPPLERAQQYADRMIGALLDLPPEGRDQACRLVKQAMRLARGGEIDTPAARGTPGHPCEDCGNTEAGSTRYERGFMRCNACGYPGQ